MNFCQQIFNIIFINRLICFVGKLRRWCLCQYEVLFTAVLSWIHNRYLIDIKKQSSISINELAQSKIVFPIHYNGRVTPAVVRKRMSAITMVDVADQPSKKEENRVRDV